MSNKAAEAKETLEVLTSTLRAVEEKASLEIIPPSQDHGEILALSPLAEGAAPLQVHVEDGRTVGFTIGRGLVIEARQGRLDREAFFSFLRAVMSAVLQGRVQETMWVVGDEVVKAKGTIELEGGERHRIYFGSLWPFRKGRPLSVSYKPY